MPTNRLAVYGTLGPEGPNHHVLSDLNGAWTKGHVHGHLIAEGWGAQQGYPGITLDPDGPAVPVDLLTSEELAQHWKRLDQFEGDGYKRKEVDVVTAEGIVRAQIYEVIAT